MTGGPAASKGKGRPKSGRRTNLALQGGGAHGAFTWGVLDRLLEDGRFGFEGISGTSAGAMNAVSLVDGYHADGNAGARAKLRQFWEAVGEGGGMAPPLRTPLDIWMGNWSVANSPWLAYQSMMRSLFSPYDLNPFDVNPLKAIVETVVDFDNVRADRSIRLFIAATNVWNGKVRVFTNPEIDSEHVLASACLPTVFQAVEIDGVPYWDGGYMGNPVLFPFIYQTECDDVLLVQINPIERTETPKTSTEIANRIDEITFNASLLREFRAIDFVRRLIDEGVLSEDQYRKLRLHRIEAAPELLALSASSKQNAEPSFLEYLFDLGRQSADKWLDGDASKVGHEPGVDLSSEFDYHLTHEVPSGVGDSARAELQRRAAREKVKPSKA